jgi:hypothetical protein
MASIEDTYLALSWASLASAGCMLLWAALQAMNRFYALQIFVCIAFLTLVAALVVLSSLQSQGMSGEEQNPLFINDADFYQPVELLQPRLTSWFALH